VERRSDLTTNTAPPALRDFQGQELKSEANSTGQMQGFDSEAMGAEVL